MLLFVKSLTFSIPKSTGSCIPMMRIMAIGTKHNNEKQLRRVAVEKQKLKKLYREKYPFCERLG